MVQANTTEICKNILRQMYSEAEPPLDFDAVLNSPESFDSDWYTQHTLPEERQNEIVEKHVEKYELSEKERSAIYFTTILDLGPSSQ